MLSLLLVLLLSAAAIVVLLYQGWTVVLAYEMPRLDPAPLGPEPGELPSVSVVVAARDEAEELGGTLDALLVQDQAVQEIVVVEGGSTDGTRAVIEARAPRVRLVEEPPLPEGWVGKNWACWNGARATSGAWLLFLDADVRLHPATVRTLVNWAERERAGLASIAPLVETVGFWERVVLPFYVQMVLTYFRAPHVNRDRSRTAMANGQCWLARRPDYFELGGHAAVRSEVLEDVALARRFRAAHHRLRVAWAPDLARTRMYRGRREMFEGLLKNIHGTRFFAARQAGFLAALLALYWLPLGLLPLGLLEGSVLLAALGGFLVAALFAKHVAFARATGTPARYGFLWPVAVGFYLTIVATSLVRGLRGGSVTWKRRAYPVRR